MAVSGKVRGEPTLIKWFNRQPVGAQYRLHEIQSDTGLRLRTTWDALDVLESDGKLRRIWRNGFMFWERVDD